MGQGPIKMNGRSLEAKCDKRKMQRKKWYQENTNKKMRKTSITKERVIRISISRKDKFKKDIKLIKDFQMES